jgi:hypothetical protein
MILSNSVVADLLSFSLGMLPSEWRRLAKQKFDHALLWDPIVGGEVSSRSFTADTDSWFVGLSAMATSRDPVTFLAEADRPYSVEVKSTSGGRDYQSAPEDFDNFFGTAQLPSVWGAPLFVKPAATIQVTLTSLRPATDRIIRVSFTGFKIFNTDMGE